MPLEPYKIKVVEPIHLGPRPVRAQALRAARYNLFRLASRAQELGAELPPPRQRSRLARMR